MHLLLACKFNFALSRSAAYERTYSMEPQVLSIPGPPILSDFRRAALAGKIGATDVQASLIFYVALHKQATALEQAALKRLLLGDLEPDAHHEDPKAAGSEKKAVYYISPRRSTISPWSSKATNIVHVCGYQGIVKRIERTYIWSSIFVTTTMTKPCWPNHLPLQTSCTIA